MSNTAKLTLMANAIRALSMDAVEAANSGHPGMPMGMADVATVLYSNHLKFCSTHPNWPDRDRFILSAGHGSMLLYSLLYLTGYSEMTIDEIKNFHEKDKYILGICLGMQILFNRLYEGKKTIGLNFFDSDVVSLQKKQKIITNTGWRKLVQNTLSENFKIDNNIYNNKQFYFCHSFYVSIKKREQKFVKYSSTLKYGISNNCINLIPSVVEKDNILGFQFHPEKSQRIGMKALSEFVNL